MISIITPTLNAEKYLPEHLASFKGQDCEHIFVDGGSTDGTLEILAGQNVIREKDTSAGEAWVNGMKAATGDVFGWLGTDDLLYEGALVFVADFFRRHREANVLVGGCVYLNERGDYLKTVYPKLFNLAKAIANGNAQFPCPSVFIRRTVIQSVDPAIIAQQDSEADYWLMVGKIFSIHTTRRVLSCFRIGSQKTKPRFYKAFKDDFERGRRFGASLFSPCALRYYIAFMLRPILFLEELECHIIR